MEIEKDRIRDKMDTTIKDSTLAFSVTPQTPVTRFLVSLSDGRTVIQNDLPGKESAWVRLTVWLKANPNISISGMRLQGPNGVDIPMPPNQKGYFWGNRQCAVWAGPQYNYTGIGYYDGQKVTVSWHRQPKFDNSFTEERTVAKAGFFLIRNP